MKCTFNAMRGTRSPREIFALFTSSSSTPNSGMYIQYCILCIYYTMFIFLSNNTSSNYVLLGGGGGGTLIQTYCILCIGVCDRVCEAVIITTGIIISLHLKIIIMNLSIMYYNYIIGFACSLS